MNSIELIRENLTKSHHRVLARIEDMRNHCLVFPTPNGGLHTLWVLGHLAFIEGLVIYEFMKGEANPLADWANLFDGDDVSADLDHYPVFDDVLAQCHHLRQSTIALLALLNEEDLDQTSSNCPEGFEQMFGTYRSCFQYVSDHWYMHRGQLADARRAAGIDKMWF